MKIIGQNTLWYFYLFIYLHFYYYPLQLLLEQFILRALIQIFMPNLKIIFLITDGEKK